ncbi:MAG: recombinase RecT, partial [Coriobacteriia bacterium]|nr:recombinase RecT [Coriobacteriia bacterium]
TVLGRNGEIIDRDGALVLGTETLVGGWVRVSRKDWPQPLFHRVGLDEYAKTNRAGELQRNWATMPATMIRKVALVQGLREAFPEQLQGLYSEEEEAPVAERAQPVRINAVEVVGATSAARIDAQPPADPPAEPTPTPTEPTQQTAPEAAAPETELMASDAQRRILIDLAKQLEVKSEEMTRMIGDRYGKRNSRMLTVAEADDLVQHLQTVAAQASTATDAAAEASLFRGGERA